MTLETFFEKFALFADAPGAVARMREMVLEMAVQGRFCEPVTSGFSPEEALQKVQEEKKALYKRGLLRRVDKPDTILELSNPPVVPAHWKLVPLSALCIAVTDGDHLPPPKTESGVPFLVISDVRWGGICFEGCRYVSEDYYEKLDWIRKPKENDILYTLVGSFGIPVVVREGQRFCVQRHIGILRPSKHVILSYLSYVLASRFVYQQAASVATGIAQKTVPLSGLRRIVIPLPPPAEQKRIVAKVDELMGLCDRLEEQEKERESRHVTLSRASLSRFADAPTPANLDFLFHKSYTIPPSDLRKSILTLAVQGKLVPQDPSDEPAEKQVNRIAQQREQFSSGKRAKAAKRIRELDEAKCAHEVPEAWTWCRLGDIVLDFRYGTSRKCDRNPSGVPVLRIPNIQSGRIDATDLKFTNMPSTEFEELRLQEGDLLLVRSNGSENLVGRSAVASSEDERFAYAGYLVRARISINEVFPPFLHVALSTPSIRDQIEGPIRTTSGVKNINTTELSNLVLPLPPLAEQRRIVAKVDQLMTLVDTLETQLVESQTAAARLLEALVAELTSQG